MSPSTDIEKAPGKELALAPTPASDEITGEDIALPRIYIGQFMSGHVQDGAAKAGSIYTATGADDPDPQTLYDGKGDGLLFHVLAMRKGKSYSDGGELTLYDFNDPAAPAEAWVTYNYVVCLPEHEDGADLPFKWLLTRTGRAAAQQINLVLKKTAAKGPSWENAFRVTTSQRENAKGKFFVARVKPVEADKKNVEIAANLAGMIASKPADTFVETGEAPAI
jgi:hypothetical protein